MPDSEKVIKGYTCCEIDASCTFCPYFSSNTCIADLRNDVFELLKEQSKQKPGHWKGFTQSRYFGTDDDGEPIFRDGVFYVCSECRRKSIIKYPYCPRCGAKMDEENEKEK